MECILLIIVTSLICLLSSTTVAAFIISCNSSSRQRQQTQQWTHNTNLSQADVRELQFNLMKLIQVDDDSTKQDMKLKSLASLLEATAISITDSMKESVVVEDNVNNLHLSEKLVPYRRFICTSPDHNDHRGNFRVFNSNEDSSQQNIPSSIPLNTICSIEEDRPFQFLIDSISYHSIASLEKRGGMMYDYSEVIVWCGSYSNSDNRLKYISKVLDDMPILQLVVGREQHSGEDSNKLCIDSRTLTTLELMGVLIEESEEQLERYDTTIMCKNKHEDLDIIEAVLSSTHQHTNELEKETIIKLIDMAVNSIRKDLLNKRKQPQLVLVAESITATRVASAISAWKQQQLDQRQLTKQRVENLLNQALVVVTFGNVCQSFPTGPAYIHVSMLDDPWSSTLGTTAKNCGDDNDAVFFHGLSPFVYNQDEWTNRQSISSLKSHNAHNTLACTIQFLALIMRINGIQSFRALYDAAKWIDPLIQLDINPKHFAVNYGKKGDLVIPPRIDDELLPAMIKATEAEKWFWMDIDFEPCLLEQHEATSHLEESFGYNAYSELCDSFSCSR